jgi:hypothetical protein
VFAQGLWVEWRRGRPDLLATGPSAGAPRALWLAWQGLMIGLLFAAILVFRSRTSLDFIYFQF